MAASEPSDKEGLTGSGGLQTAGEPSIIEAAARQDRSKCTLKGYLRKKSRQERWQKRWFEAVGHYLAYYKTHSSDKLLACIDLRQVGESRLVPDSAVGEPACEFSIALGERTYFMKAKTHSDAVRWVQGLNAIHKQYGPGTDAADVSVDIGGADAGTSGDLGAGSSVGAGAAGAGAAPVTRVVAKPSTPAASVEKSKRGCLCC